MSIIHLAGVDMRAIEFQDVIARSVLSKLASASFKQGL
jgi:hypothetical protein